MSTRVARELASPDELLDDKELTLAFQRGEKGAYQAIHDRYQTRIQSVCRRLLLDREDAQEAAQESFLRIYQALGRFNGRYQLGPWISKITTNVCLDHLRARGRRGSIPFDLDDLEPTLLCGNGDEDPEQLTIRKAEGRRILKVLASLQPSHRAAIVLRDLEGFTYKEIAVALETSETQVKALLHRARQSFKKSWASSGFLALPARFFQRLRRLETPAKEHAGQYSAQAIDAASSTAHFAASCSNVLQQCGQFVAERMAPAFTALIAATALGSSAVANGGEVSEPERRQVQVMSTLEDPASEESRRVERKRPQAAIAESEEGEEDDAAAPGEPDETAQQPAPQPSPSTDGNGEGEGGGGNTTTPQPPPEPTGFGLAFASDAAQSSPCSCLWATQVEDESVAAEGKVVSSFSQTLRGTASASGAPSYGLRLEHEGDQNDHHMEFFLHHHEGSYGYRAAGTLVSIQATPWGGWSYNYEGTYKLSSSPGKGDELPKEGGYEASVTISWRQQRVIALNVSLIESG